MKQNGNDNPPKEYRFSADFKAKEFKCLRFPEMKDVQYYYKEDKIVPLDGQANLVLKCNPTKELDVWITGGDPLRYGGIIWTKTYQEAQFLENYIKCTGNKESGASTEAVTIYRCNKWDEWEKSQECSNLSLDQYVGYQDYYHQIVKDITNWKTNKEKLEKINSTSPRNYMLYGVPGSGKTSLVRLIAQHFGVPIFVGNLDQLGAKIYAPDDMDGEQVPFVISLMEDLDKGLNGITAESEYMSNLLNVLDGVDTQTHVIRFFTGNFCEAIQSNRALESRMMRMLYFSHPNKELYDARIRKIDEALDTSVSSDPSYPQLLERLDNMQISFRETVQILSRHIFDEAVCENVLEDLELLKSMPKRIPTKAKPKVIKQKPNLHCPVNTDMCDF